MRNRVRLKSSFGRALLLAGAAITALSGFVVIGVVNAQTGRWQSGPTVRSEASPIVINVERPETVQTAQLQVPQNPRITSPQNPTEAAQEAFEIASVRLSRLDAGRGGPRGGGATGCAGPPPQIAGNRIILTTDLFKLIGLAYGKDCFYMKTHGLLAGGPGWVKSDQFAIQALIPEGSPRYTANQLDRAEAPRLAMMIQNLLADRFKLALHRENREVPIYALTVAKGGPKLHYEEGSCDPTHLTAPPRPGQKRQCVQGIGGLTSWRLRADGLSVDEFSNLLSFPLNRPIINKTGITGVFNIYLEFAMDETAPFLGGLGGAPGAAPPDPIGPSIFSAIQEQLGLKLESSKGPVEVLVIDHVERPTEN